MPFVEVFSPKGCVSEEQRKRISERLVAEVMRGEGAPDTEAARSLSWLLWHEPEVWGIGGRTISDGEPPRYVVRVTVPAASLDDEKRAEIVRRVTQVLAEVDEDPGRMFGLPIASFVLLNEIPEGNWGSLGQVFRFPEIEAFINADSSAGQQVTAS
jgi:phenylpyruvate tautomerase PptA (4-oxalocrotonate tautomerase family)